jgi:hypothetical protein
MIENYENKLIELPSDVEPPLKKTPKKTQSE